jgi:hypothetical protein
MATNDLISHLASSFDLSPIARHCSAQSNGNCVILSKVRRDKVLGFDQHSQELRISAHVAAATRSRRGYSLGATDLADLLLAERLAGDAFRTEAETRVQALRAICQLMIDSHNLWIGGD